jgi:hypothetical protein
MEASDNPGIVQSANITSDESVEPAVTAGVAPAPIIAMPEALLQLKLKGPVSPACFV